MFDKRLMQVCPESKKYIIGNIMLQFLELVCNTIMIIMIAGTIENLYQNRLEASQLIFSATVIAVTIIARFFTSKYAVRMIYIASKTVKQKMREMIYGKLLKLGSKYREQVSTAELVQESVEGVDQLESYFGQYVPQFFYAFIAPVMLFFLFGFGGSWGTATVLLVCVPLIPGAIMMVQKVAKKLLSKYWGQYTQLGSTFLENLQGMTTLKTYQADEFKNQQMNEESEHFRFITMKVLTMQLNSIIIMDFFAYGGAALGIIMTTRAFVNGNIGLTNCIFMILLSADFFLPMRRLGSYFHVAMNGMAASDKIFKFLNLDEPTEKSEEIEKNFKKITLENVHFSYDSEREILHGISMEIPQNRFIGIVGASGCGKSTIASLLMGRNTINSGNLMIGGRNITDLSETSLMKTLTYISHNSTFFKGTVRENLLLGNPNASDSDLWRVLDSCNLSAFLKSENGLDTQLLENAGNLSGGQKQRLALARAILHDSSVYIFDEATSNIDVESEEIILSQIEKMKSANTIIMISHRLANVQNADCIYALEKGSIAEYGIHSQLLQKGGVYAKLWETQSELENFGKGKTV
ncbi:MAG: ABC transporter ATP-binding protein/permease [Ruminococcus flavefaciens]|nr:ABC transporter ATP-binding protein/permease [Ruminococcus flavefaciens]